MLGLKFCAVLFVGPDVYDLLVPVAGAEVDTFAATLLAALLTPDTMDFATPVSAPTRALAADFKLRPLGSMKFTGSFWT